jgi:DNA-binding NarL/FixJ family response regulator
MRLPDVAHRPLHLPNLRYKRYVVYNQTSINFHLILDATTMTTLHLELPEAFAQALARRHPDGLEAAAAVALKAFLKGGRPRINAERDAQIMRLILDGKRRADIAREYNISIVRINQIAAANKGATS